MHRYFDTGSNSSASGSLPPCGHAAGERDAAAGWLSPAAVLRGWIPAAFVLFAGSLLISAWIYFAPRPFSFAKAVISYLQFRGFNPEGFGYAAVGTLLCGPALWPASILFLRRLHGISRAWSVTGVSLYRIGLTGVSLIGLLSLFDVHPWSPFHIFMGFVGFIGVPAGLITCLAVAAARPVPARWCLAMLACLLLCVLSFETYLLMTPGRAERSGPFTSLAAVEWGMSVAVAATTLALAKVLQKPVAEARSH